MTVTRIFYQFKEAESDLYACLRDLQASFVNHEHKKILDQAIQNIGDKFIAPINLDKCDQKALLKLKEKILKINTDSVKVKSISFTDWLAGLFSSKRARQNLLKKAEYEKRARARKEMIRTNQEAVANLTFRLTLEEIFKRIDGTLFGENPAPQDKTTLVKLKSKVTAIRKENIQLKNALIDFFAPRSRDRMERLKQEIDAAHEELEQLIQTLDTKIKQTEDRVSHRQGSMQSEAVNSFHRDYCNDQSLFRSDQFLGVVSLHQFTERVNEICRIGKANYEVKNRYNFEMQLLHKKGRFLDKKARSELKKTLDECINAFMKENDIEAAILKLDQDLAKIYIDIFKGKQIGEEQMLSLYTLLSTRALKQPQYLNRIVLTYIPDRVFQDRPSIQSLNRAKFTLATIGNPPPKAAIGNSPLK